MFSLSENAALSEYAQYSLTNPTEGALEGATNKISRVTKLARRN